MTPDEIKTILEAHARWLRGEEGGRRANLRGVDLQGADLRGADLRGAYLRDADFRGADFRRAVFLDADLRGAVFRDADLRDADLEGADLEGADLEGADLRDAVFRGADLRDANFRRADLRRADFHGADLRGAHLEGADLEGARLWGCVGNDREIKSAQTDKYPLAWIKNPDGVDTLQIGCQQHALAEWETFTDEQIEPMDHGALPWWHKNKAWIIDMVKNNPATPYGKVTE